MRSNSYTLGFAAVVCVVCSLFVSGAATLFKAKQAENERMDVQKNILRCVGVLEQGSKPTAKEVAELYETRITEAVIDKDGRIIEGLKPSQLDAESYLKPEGTPEKLPVYIARDSDGRTSAYAFPIAGKGLWSTLYGYLAVEPDAKTVKGITFFKHGETPGLGAEIEQPWFQNNFKGKTIVDESGKPVSIRVVKGKASEAVAQEELPHAVDGISGATMTSNGVTRLLKTGLGRYEPFFSEARRKS